MNIDVNLVCLRQRFSKFSKLAPVRMSCASDVSARQDWHRRCVCPIERSGTIERVQRTHSHHGPASSIVFCENKAEVQKPCDDLMENLRHKAVRPTNEPQIQFDDACVVCIYERTRWLVGVLACVCLCERESVPDGWTCDSIRMRSSVCSLIKPHRRSFRSFIRFNTRIHGALWECEHEFGLRGSCDVRMALLSYNNVFNHPRRDRPPSVRQQEQIAKTSFRWMVDMQTIAVATATTAHTSNTRWQIALTKFNVIKFPSIVVCLENRIH